MGLVDRFKRAWDAFSNKDPTNVYDEYGESFGYRPDRVRYSRGNERTLITAIYNRLATDAASAKIQHVRLDEYDRFLHKMTKSNGQPSYLNDVLSVEANLDQSGRAFIQDVVMTMLDDGCAAIVPTYTTKNPLFTDDYKILALRVGRVTQWFPKAVKVQMYNDKTGKKQEKIFPKRLVALVENPYYAVMNERSSTLQRLVHKLSLLDQVDNQSSSGKLDLIIQLPYVIKSKSRKEQAEARRKDIEQQLTGSKYGIAYTDGTEKIIQLNRAIENNLMQQIEYLTKLLFSQLGLTEEILNGTANEEAMTNYYTRTVEPLVSAICDEMARKFLSQTARSQRQTIMFFRDPFRLLPASKFGDIGDKMRRNEIMTTNELRQAIGMVPSEDSNADSLYNPNMPSSDQGMGGYDPEMEDEYGDGYDAEYQEDYPEEY